MMVVSSALYGFEQRLNHPESGKYYLSTKVLGKYVTNLFLKCRQISETKQAAGIVRRDNEIFFAQTQPTGELESASRGYVTGYSGQLTSDST